MANADQCRVVIIGSGFAGLGLAIQLKRAGIDSFTILEKATSLGGTWRDNSYPGAACDVPSMLYCFSFDQKYDWSRKWSPRDEIREYLEDSAQRHSILSHIRFGIEVDQARFDETSGAWVVHTTDGEEIHAEVLVSGVGQLHHPSIPRLPGLDDFRGESFHSACWNHAYDLAGKRVAVIGNAASAIQFIPQIAKQAQQVSIFQRSANWMIPRNDRTYGPRDRWLFDHVPGYAWLYRARIWAMAELLLLPMIQREPWATRMYERVAKRYLEQTVSHPALREVLTPDYPIGGKRVLISDDYYQALTRNNVQVITEPIERFTEHEIAIAGGNSYPVDAVIFATGFRTNPFLAPMRIVGLQGRKLEDDWSQGARAYYGMTLSGYPNFFMLYGPNTNLGHNSIIFMLECQINYVISAIRALKERHLHYIDVRPEVLDSFNVDVQRSLQNTAWAAAGASWYKDAAGRITNNWPYSTLRYWWKTRRIALRDYNVMSHSVSVGSARPRAQRAAA